MIERYASRLAVWGLGIAGMLAFSTPVAHASFVEYTTTVTIDQTPGSYTPSAGSTFPTGTEPITQGTFTQIAPFAGFRTANGNEVDMIALRSNPAAPHINTAGSGSDFVFAQVDASTAFLTTVAEHVAFNYTFTLVFNVYPAVNSLVPSGTATVQFTGRIDGTIGNNEIDLNNLVFATVPSNGLISSTDGQGFKITTAGYVGPGTDNNGTIGGHIQAVPVPEPASMGMLGLGGLGAVGLFRRRKAKASA